MLHTFDIRFAASAGIGAMLAAPSNTLRWKGAGRISVNSESVTIGVKRGFLSLFMRNRSRRIPAEQLREVYREGDALRLEFTGPENSREVVPLWAADRDAAARIVQLLPTTRTVEVEQAPGYGTPKFRPDLRAIGVLFAGVFVIAAAVMALRHSHVIPAAPLRAEAEPVERAPEIAPLEIPAAPPPVRIEDPVVPIPRGTRAYGFAQTQLALFQKESAALLEEYRLYRTMLETDALTTEGFTAKLDGPIANGWWKITFRILEEPQFDDPALVGLRATLLAAARHWRAFLELYTEGLQQNDSVLITRSFSQLSRAEWLQLTAQRYVR